MWMDRTDTRKAIGKLATKLGHATALDRRSVVHVLRYLKGVPKVMTVKGETFDEDILKQAPARRSGACASGRRLGRN